MIAPSLPQLFQPYLFAGERIVWTGRPKQGLTLSARDALLVPFSLMWGGFAIFWNVGVWLAPFDSSSSDAPGWFFKLWGIPFLVAGLYLIVGRFFHDAYIRKQLLYAVTDRRVLVLRGSKLTSLDINRLPHLELSEFRDGTGTLAFEATGNMTLNSMNGFSWWLPTLASATQFFRIREARKVYELVRRETPA